MLEAIGYLASVIVAVSLMMSSLPRLRIVNLVGALLFAAARRTPATRRTRPISGAWASVRPRAG